MSANRSRKALGSSLPSYVRAFTLNFLEMSPRSSYIHLRSLSKNPNGSIKEIGVVLDDKSVDSPQETLHHCLVLWKNYLNLDITCIIEEEFLLINLAFSNSTIQHTVQRRVPYSRGSMLEVPIRNGKLSLGFI